MNRLIKLHIIIISILININTSAQEIILCKDTISFKSEKTLLHLKINDKILVLNTNIADEPNYTVSFSFECIDDGFDLIYKKQLGNEYQIYHYLFNKFENTYINTNIYTVFSNRQEYILNATLGSKEEIEKFVISSNFTGQSDAITIQRISGFQDEEQIIDKPYNTLIRELYKQKRYNDLKLATNKFVLKELDLLNSESIIDLNNIAFYIQRAGLHKEAIHLLKEILNKDSKRIVAHLNIADSYWELNQKKEAIMNYKEYCELMKTQKKDLKKIPDYVIARIKNN